MLESIESDDQAFCVDFFERPDGGFGFEHFRSDPEDGGAWTSTAGYSATLYENASAAAQGAQSSISWLGTDVKAASVFDRWVETVRT